MAPIIIDADFPGGNIGVDRIAGDDVYLHQERRDSEGWWFYWAFRLRGAAGRTLRFHFTDGKPVGPRGPGISLDGGRSWRWHEGQFDEQSFTLAAPPAAEELFVAFARLYTQEHWRRFVTTLPAGGPWREGQLARTRKGRAVEMLSAGCLDPNPAFRVAVTARHHCCEMMANCVMEGIVAALLAGTDSGDWLRRHVQFLFVPFVDKDGVEDGDQGKNRRPRDHNRDYDGQCVHIETAALRDLLPAWGGSGGVQVALDLHCPWIRGHNNDIVYQVGREDPRIWGEQQRFGALLEGLVGPHGLPYRQSSDLPFGASWNTAANYAGGMSFTRWAAGLPGMRLSTSFEIPYDTAGGAAMTGSRARAFGHDLAAALAAYLRS